ncbi:hypothetical protein BJX99DRAFT_263799 [Aspergillus californicus]
MVFYTLAFFWDDKHRHTYSYYYSNGRDQRYLIMTPDRPTADLFFRFLQDQLDVGDKAKFCSVTRLSPQMFSWCGDNEESITWAIDYINEGSGRVPARVLNELKGRVFYKRLGKWNDDYRTFPILPELDVKDHINTATFCIRNARVPQRFWYVPGDLTSETDVQVSIYHRSKFEIKMTEDAGLDKSREVKRLMIHSDNVYIHVVRDRSRVPIVVNRKRTLQASPDEDPKAFPFGGLRGQKFHVELEKSDNENSNDGPGKITLKFKSGSDNDTGEIWELC